MRLQATTILILATITLLSCGRPERIDEDQAIVDAIHTADNWLQLVDDRNYEASWEATSDIFKRDGDLQMWRNNIDELLNEEMVKQIDEVDEGVYRV